MPVVGEYMTVPRQLVEVNAAVTLAADVFFVDGTAFLMTVSRRIKFGMGYGQTRAGEDGGKSKQASD